MATSTNNENSDRKTRNTLHHNMYKGLAIEVGLPALSCFAPLSESCETDPRRGRASPSGETDPHKATTAVLDCADHQSSD